MSSTHGFVLPNEAYPTPETHVRTMLDKLVLRSTDKFLEPCRGEKQAIFKQVDLPSSFNSRNDFSMNSVVRENGGLVMITSIVFSPKSVAR